jgi:endonuclease/exonuclease/phosphatase (EEP) superfamily protein YafD
LTQGSRRRENDHHRADASVGRLDTSAILPFLPTLLAILGAALLALCSACATVPAVQHAFTLGSDGSPIGRPLPCGGGAARADAGAIVLPLPGPDVRVLSWNLHKNGDPGWDADLARFAARSDLLLIQEAALTDRLRRVLRDGGYEWLLANAFTLNSHATGVLSAARARPTGACVQRSFEPLLRLPKAAAIARYEVHGVADRLAVANLHAINFTLGVVGYRAQLEAVARELADHRGPVIVAGDFNTWSPTRLAVVEDVMRRLDLVAVEPTNDGRSRFFGRHVDYVFVRGLDVVRAEAPAVASSDHNPLLTTLRVRDTRLSQAPTP